MIDIHSTKNTEQGNTDITLKDFYNDLIKNYLSSYNKIKYFENTGFNTLYWLNNKITFAVETFQKYLTDNLINLNIPVKSLTVYFMGNIFRTLTIDIDVNV